MAHRTKVNGTNYSIIGGRTKVDGTNYKIIGGRTKINGTNYSISFGKPLTVSGTYQDASNGSYLSYATFNGTILIKDGEHTYDDTYDSIQVKVEGLQTAYSQYNRVYLNGTLVKSGAGTYKLTNINNYNSIKIVFESQNYNTYFYCYITTT